MSEFNNIVLFDDVSMETVIKDIYNKSKSKSNQIELVLNTITKLVKDSSDATVLMPLITEYTNSSIKNDDQLIKLGMLVQKFISKSTTVDESNSLILSESEKKQLLESASDIIKNIENIPAGSKK